MDQISTSHITGIDEQQLTPLVRKALQQDRAEIASWQTEPLRGGIGDLGAGLVGVYRFYGQAHIGDSLLPWSIVLKSSRAAADRANVAYLQREWYAYHSNHLTAMNGPVVAPICLETSQQPDDLHWIWLEHLVDAYPQPWAVSHYAAVAQHFGQWNGSYLTSEPLPNYPWFCHSAAREWAAQATPEVEFLHTVVDHPVVQQVYPNGQASAILQLWDERERFFEALERLPQTVCHNDAFRRNLFGRRQVDGSIQTVAIDWAYIGWGALGEEVAALVIGNVAFGEVNGASAEAFATQVFDHYLSGLRKTGWAGNSQAVRLGFTAAAAMKYCFPYTLRSLFSEEGQAWLARVQKQPNGDPFAAAIQKRAFVFRLANEARQLIIEHT